jgi:pyruvate dehydrogenase E2 component (dihydrolipoamide acetyltransferase)
MDTERGLVVPVVRDVDRKNIIEISVELKEITAKARDGKLAVNDMRGGNMTITNAGALGGDTFVPIVNWPEAAILGVARSRTEAVFQGGEFKPRQMLPLALSYDHRLIDGADGVRFMRWIIEALENPVKLAWEG